MLGVTAVATDSQNAEASPTAAHGNVVAARDPPTQAFAQGRAVRRPQFAPINSNAEARSDGLRPRRSTSKAKFLAGDVHLPVQRQGVDAGNAQYSSRISRLARPSNSSASLIPMTPRGSWADGLRIA